jgi:hypothetical protein
VWWTREAGDRAYRWEVGGTVGSHFGQSDPEVGCAGPKLADGDGLGAVSTQNTLMCRIASPYIYTHARRDYSQHMLSENKS